MRSNKFLRLIINDRNKEWRKDFIDLIESDQSLTLNIHDNEIVIQSKYQTKDNVNYWSKKVNMKIGSMFPMFRMEKITYKLEDLQEIQRLIEKIEDIRKIYLIDYFDDRLKMTLDVIGKKIHIEDFFQRYPELNKFRNSKSRTGTANDNDKIDEDSIIVIKSINVPKNLGTFIGLICLSLKKVKEKFELQECDFNNYDLSIDLIGGKNNVESAIACLNKSMNSIRCKKVDVFTNKNMTQAKNFNSIIKDVLKNVEQHCFKVHIQGGDDHEHGIFITYFEDCPELDSDKDHVFQTISKYLQCSIAHFEIDATRYETFLQSDKWKQFEKEILVDTNNFSFNMMTNKDGQITIYLTGKKSFILLIKVKIEDFLSKNEFRQQSIKILEEDVRFYFLLQIV